MALSQCQGRFANLWLASLLAMVIGFNWVVVPTNFNIATQRSVPGWVKGRAIAMYMTVLFGSFAVGGELWGQVADRVGISNASLIAGICILLGLFLVKPFPLTRARGHDFSLVNRPAPSDPAISGGVAMVVNYRIQSHRAAEFAQKMQTGLRHQRLRNGAIGWALREVESSGDVVHYEECCDFRTWSDHLRFHSRTTKIDVAQEEEVKAFLAGAETTIQYRPASTTTNDIVSPGPPRHMPHPPPVIDWDRVMNRALEEFDAIWNRIIREWYRK